MNAIPQQNREERSVVTGFKAERNRITDRFKDGQAAGPQHRGSAVRGPRPGDPEPTPPALRRVLKEAKGVNFRMPDAGSFRGRLPAGKVLSAEHYDFADLKSQGVILGAVEDEVVGVPQQGGSGSAQIQLKDMLAALASLGLEVRPAGQQAPQVTSPEAPADPKAPRKER